MEWQIDRNNCILNTETIRLSASISGTGTVHFQIREQDAGEPWMSFIKEDTAVRSLTAKQQGSELVIRGDDIKIRIGQDLSVTMEKDGEVFFAAPKHCIWKEKDILILSLKLNKDEKIYGLGQDPMAQLNLNGFERRMWNQWSGGERSGNCGIGFYQSDAGYGLFLNSSSDARFRFGKSRPPVLHPLGEMMVPSLWEEGGELNDEEARIEIRDNFMDLYILPGKTPEDLLRGYYELTGYPKPMPKWAYGFLQCKNRYMNRQDLLQTGKLYRDKKIPCDGLVIDWLWFSDFGDLTWREDDWPDAEGMLKELNGLGFHVSSAQHPFISEHGKYYTEYRDKNYLNIVPETKRITYDHTNPEARRHWWNRTKGLYEQGLCGYWIDMGELEEHFDGTISYGGDRTRTHNAYSYLWSKGLYEGQRGDYGTRPFILSRSGCVGIQQFGTAIWSGDIDASWRVLADQVVIGQGMAMSGIPHWTTDVGGFYSGKEFTPELYLRWAEWGAFCGVFRTHGTRPENEVWSFGETGEKLLTNIINLRYKLIPYIYSLALEGTKKGTPIVRPMVYDYGQDATAVSTTDQFMFGPSILVAPVTRPGMRSRKVYLPEGDWYDWHSGKRFAGGWQDVLAPLGQIPLFVKAGSIIPTYSYIGNNVAECGKLTLLLFPGNDGSFDYYDDDGETYDYENGQYTHIHFTYDDSKGKVKSNIIRGTIQDYSIEYFQHNSKTMVITADAVTENGGNTIITATFGRDFAGELELICEDGWRILSCSMDGHDNRNMFEAMKGSSWKKDMLMKYSEAIRWELAFTPDYIRVGQQKAMLILTEKEYQIESEQQKEGRLQTELPVTFGNSYLEGFSLAGCFKTSEEDDIDTVFEPEQHPENMYYQDNGTTIYWQQDTEYGINCFGYVDFRRLKPYQDGEEINGTAYAKGILFAKEEMEAAFILRYDSPVKIRVNNREIYTGRMKNMRGIELKMRLQAGYNVLLIKQTARIPRPYSGGEFGFSLNYTGDEDLWRVR